MNRADIQAAKRLVSRRDSGPALFGMLQSGKLDQTFFRRQMEKHMLAQNYEVVEHLKSISRLSERSVAVGLAGTVEWQLKRAIAAKDVAASLRLARHFDTLVWAYHLEEFFGKMVELKNAAYALQPKPAHEPAI